MRKIVPLAAAAVALAGLAGCGTLPADRHAPSSYRESLDVEVMAAVEQGAMRSGASVHWVNPPRKKKE